MSLNVFLNQGRNIIYTYFALYCKALRIVEVTVRLGGFANHDIGIGDFY